MDEWTDGWASYFLCWAASSLSDLFAEAPLLPATSSLVYFCLSYPPAARLNFCTQWFSSRNCYNAFSNLQLQFRLPGASQHNWTFPARSRANAFCHSRLQTRIAGASHQIHQRPRSADHTQTRAAPNLQGFLRFLCEIELYRAHFANLVFQKCSAAVSFLAFWSANRALATWHDDKTASRHLSVTRKFSN